MMKCLHRTAVLALPMAMIGSALAATSGSHYSPGGEGVEAGTPPPPGMHYRLYNTWYDADTLTDDNGDAQQMDFSLEVFAQAHRFVNVTDTKIFGANWAYNLIVPVIDKEIAIGGAFDAASGLEVGDIVIEPLALFWFNPRFDAILAIAAIAPTGDYSADKPESVGYGYWSGMITAGGTYFFDDDRSWSFSTLSRTLWHGHQDDTGIRPGMEFCLEGGVGKNILLDDHWLIRPGVSYSAGWQISDDSKDGAGSIADQRKRSFGLGAELNVMYLPWLLQANLRFHSEFDSNNTAEGESLVLTFTKSF
ncbi:SphA family protein [Ferrimonas futtsuensis]|uniref:SphA family protein n=1 Tax=Ferrimonas futtsuensis TaxID=364764 RepID=UPI000429E220|nr:transporter [Ferrimonas futtsuensis]